jgi:hypothetical protein
MASGRTTTLMTIRLLVSRRWLREDLWRGKVEAAAVRYSENPCTETMAAYRSVLKEFADLVLRRKVEKRPRRT